MEVLLLGLVEASHDGHALPLGGAKPRALLAMLALHANTPVSADRLIEGLWGERPPATAPKLVQVLVSQLRKQLAGSDAEIVTRGRGYELRVDPDAVDALRFERLLTSGENGSHVRRGARAVARPAARRPRRRAVRRARDPAARGPLAAARARRRSTARWPTGATRRCWASSTSWSREHPLREHLHGQRMLALYRSGRQAEALEAFRHARAGPARRGRARAGSRAARPQRRDPAPGPGARRSARPPVRRAARRRRPALAARRRRPWRSRRRSRSPSRSSARLGGGLDGIAEDATGVIDPGNGHIVAQYAVGHAPDALAAGGGSVWSANGRDGTVSRVDRGHGQVTTIDVGGEPTAVAFGERFALGRRRREPPRRPGRLRARTASSAVCPRATRRAAWRSPAARSGSPRRSTARWSGSTSRAGAGSGGSRSPAGPPRSPRAAARCGWPARRTASSPSSIRARARR